MKHIGKTTILVVVALLLVTTAALAAIGDFEPTTTWNVTPQLKTFPDDRVCPAGTTLFKDKFQSVTQGVDEGTFTDSIVIDGVTVTVEIKTKADNSFDFKIINGVTRQMFVKGSNYLLYQYDPPVSGATNTGPVSYDTGLHDGTGGSTTQYQDVSHLDFCLTPVYPLRAEKDAAGTYDRTVTWELVKNVNSEGNDLSAYVGVAGDEFPTDWLLFVDKTEVSDNYKVTGDITVYNDNVFAVPFAVSDKLNDGTVATVDCGGATEVPAASGGVAGELTCSYSASPSDASATLNTATITSAVVGGTTATADVDFEENLIGYDSGTLTDDRFTDFSETVSGDASFTLEENFVCPTDPSAYGTDGSYTAEVPNTAYLNGNINLDDDATITLDCTLPALQVVKDAAGTYDRTVTWELVKNVNSQGNDLSEYVGVAGDTFPTDWLLYVDKSEAYSSYQVTGDITINNPAAVAQEVTGVADVLNDSTVASVDCGAAFPIEIAAGGQLVCSYVANSTYTGLPEGAPNTNTATVSAVGNADQTATATPINYTETLIGYDSGTLTDDRFPLFSQTVSGDANFTLEEDFVCPTDRAAYDVNGKYSSTVPNTAYLNGNINLDDDATITIDCEASFVDIYKTTNGQPADPTQDIQFTLFSGTTELETVSTSGVGPELEFQTALVPADSYTICEYPVPAGYTFEVSENGSVVLTYAGPPGATDPTGEIQCFDFTAPDPDTQVTITFNIENSFPGGAPRTPGYWKNWNTCSDGNQAATANKLNGGLDPTDPDSAGVFLLDDLLPQTLGNNLTINTCEEGVLILDARDLTEVDKKGQPENRSNDAAYTLARALLAARLNQDAGACTAAGFDFLGEYGFDGTFEQLLTAADDVLTAVEFDGSGSFLSPQDLKGKNNPLVPLAEEALYLYEIIDDYNNGYICTGEYSH